MSEPTADFIPVLATGLAGAAAFLLAGAYGAAHPASTMWGPVISRGPSDLPRVALTFDDGPLSGTTDRVLDVLGESNVRAAFFVIGRHAQRWPELVRRIHDEGHLVGNHSFDHLHTGMFGRYRYWSAELKRADDVIEQIIGRRPAVFRPPMGLKHWHVTNAAADAGHSVVTWSRRARDVRATSAQVILDRLLKPARAGDVLLMHDGDDPCRRPQDRGGVRDAVRPLVDGLRRRGLEPARLDDLLGIPAYQVAPPSPAPVPAPRSAAARDC
jgi:peptidoglycan/xylan/chitin deacetylase (PgdA/CDA1 family)